MTRVYDWQNSINESELSECAKSIKDGGIVVFPTETVYGIGTNAYYKESVRNIYKVKQRPNEKPLCILVKNSSDIEKYAYISNDIEKKIIKKFMPGPLTIILKKKEGTFDYISSGKETIGIRIPNNNIALELLNKADVPIVAPSANISGQPSGINFEDVLKDFYGKVDICINGGKSKLSTSSTIVQVLDNKPVILRQGPITQKQIEIAVNSN